ncbi:MAG: sigma-70 family RNA polymerase sigma factor [Myxococcales bacterium]|nr:sigma-70 family RNA polymerase sigma factor [Myxococcales bacterium]MCB9751163.1 sigma-70 family RNA polymerase sigma factor [Myxococcales bacterium]
MESDHELLQAWQAGDARAGSTLFERHYKCVARFFSNKVDADIADLIQKTFLGCLESLHRFRGDASFKTYLLSIARNVLLMYYRRKRRHDARLDPGVTSIQDLGPTPTTLIQRHDEAKALLLGLRALPIDSQILLELYYWESMRAREIAAVFEVPEGTIRTRLRKAKQQLLVGVESARAGGHLTPHSIEDLDDWARRLRAASA